MRVRRIVGAVLVAATAAVLSILSADAVAVDSPVVGERRLGELQIDARDASTGAPLAVRARIVPRSLLRAELVRVDRQGRVRAELTPGSYRVIVSHGPEWSVFEQTLEIDRGQVTALRARLTRLVDASAYTACDLHVHTSASPDSDLALSERVATLLAEDVQFAVITDHNRVSAVGEELARAGIASLPGVEVTTWEPEFGHFNVFPRATPPRYSHSSAPALLRELRAGEPSFVQVNHPRLEHHIGHFALMGFDRQLAHSARSLLAFDAIEVWNGYDVSAPTRRDEVFLDWLALLARGRRITATGGSDSHRADALPYVGYPRTYVHVPRARAQEPGRVLAALKHGRSFVSNGPILDLRVRGRGPGETVHLARGERVVSVQVEAAAPAWMALREVEVWVDGERAAQAPLRSASIRSPRASVRLEVPVPHARTVLATVRGAGSMKALLGRAQITPYAFTNPVWIARL